MSPVVSSVRGGLGGGGDPVEDTWEFGTDVERGPDETVIRVRGEVDMHTAPELWRSAASVLEPGRRVVIDVRDVAFMDSQGVKVLAKAVTEVGETGRVTVRGARATVRRVIEITGLARVIDVEE